MRRVVVIPCFNEAARLDAAGLLELCELGFDVIFVDDGSSDGTRARLHEIALKAPPGRRIEVLGLDQNRGKGEAVRAGMNRALEDADHELDAERVDVVGYLDADLATPPREMRRVADALEGDVEVALGARVRTMGRHIERRALRHYLGRVFGTAASLVLGTAVYDTQCGAKAFRSTPALVNALSTPFETRWVFDVELLSRLMDTVPVERFREVPLEAWRDVRGSSLGPRAMLKAALDLARIARRR